jgi:DNA-binding beta-propeller fold protein YncE
MAGRPTWVSVPLAAPFQFRPGQERTYWMVLQSLDGEAAWSVEEAAPALPGMQLTQDGGFSWRQAALAQSARLAGLFRLRYQPATFRMPIELQVGSGDASRRVDLSRFEPQGRVDLSFSDLPEVVEALNQALEAAPGRCPEIEHLANGGFEQWVRRGRQLGAAHAIPLEMGTLQTLLAASPDGRWAYVASKSDKGPVFQIVDLDLETRVESLPLQAGSPLALAIAPDGARAYVGLSIASPTGPAFFSTGLPAEEQVLQLIDLVSRQPLGGALRLLPTNVTSLQPPSPPYELRGLAFSPDGRRLYAALVEVPAFDSLARVSVSSTSPEARLLAFDTALLEEAALRRDADSGVALLADETLAVAEPVDLAVSPDGTWLYVLSSRPLGELFVIDPQTLREQPSRSFDLKSDGKPLVVRSMALTPDGGTAVVVHARGTALVDLAEGRVLASFDIGGPGGGVALEPDGSRTFLAGPRGFEILDLARRAAVDSSLRFLGLASDVAVTPAGDRVLVTDLRAVLDSQTSGPGLQVISIGEVLPAEWAVTAGRVRRYTVPGTLGRFAVLGTVPDDPKDMELPGPSAISQVVPVAPCTYELSFQGIATEEDAIAEVFWRGEGCGLLRKDIVPIAVLDPRRAAAKENFLVFHRARLEAPAGAAQAEVRLTAPAGAVGINDVSLRATDAAVQAGELRGRDLPASWRQVPEAAAGFAVVAKGESSRLSNRGLGEVALVRDVPVAEAGTPFALEIQGRTVPVSSTASSMQGSRIELRWLGPGGEESASPAVFEIRPDSFDALAATGTVPAGTVGAELRLALPAGTELDIRRLDLRFPEPAAVPITFVAQAPGELAVLDWELLYDQVPVPRPRLPEGGLCPPTPPPLPAGLEGPDHGGCGCDAEGVPVVVQPVAAPAPVLALHRLRPARQTMASVEPVTAIRGIGKGRSHRLREAGMDSIEALAASSPGTLRQMLPGISEKAAVDIILAARDKLRAPRA